MGNNALVVNDPYHGVTADVTITSHGSDVYWAVCSVMTVATIAFLGHSFTQPRSHRIFHLITAAVTMTAAIAYYSMGSDLGQVAIDIEFLRSNPVVHGATREIFYVRYIDWVITTPLLLLDLLLTAGIPLPHTLFVIFVDEVMIVTGLVGALTGSVYKWGYFTFGCVAMIWVIYFLVFEARRSAMNLGADVHRVYIMCGVLTSFMWFLYPIAWGLSEGGNVIAPDSEAVFYGILDSIAKPVFGALLIFGHRNIDPTRLGLHIEGYGEKDMSINNKKHPDGPNVAAGTNGNTNTTSTV